MKTSGQYQVKSYDLYGLSGISDQTLQLHFGLYEGYVKASNALRAQLNEFMRDGKVDQEEMPAYSELTRRLGFEYNGMVLHEYYFGNLRRGGSDRPTANGGLGQAIEQTFGSFERWKADFCSVGMMRGVGWAICNVDPSSGRISNHWITLHEHGNVAGFVPDIDHGCLGARLPVGLQTVRKEAIHRRILFQYRLEHRRRAVASRACIWSSRA